MAKIRITLDDSLLAQVDQAATEQQITRSAFIRAAVELALRQHIRLMEERHAQGYAQHPIPAAELAEWEDVHVWDDPGPAHVL